MGKKIFKKAIIDPFIKYSALAILYIGAVLAMIFALISLTVKTGAELGESYTTSVYVTPYDVASESTDKVFFFDQTKKPYTGSANDTSQDDYISDLNSPNTKIKWVLPSESELDAKLRDVYTVYAQRLSILGYQEPQVEKSIQTKVELPNSTSTSDYLNSSWLNNQTALGLTITVGAPKNVVVEGSNDAVDHNFLIQQFINDQLSLSNQLSLETTDGVIIFSNNDVVKDTIKATTNTTGVNKSVSNVSFELHKSKQSSVNALDDLVQLALENDPNKDLSNTPLGTSSFNTPYWNGVTNTSFLANLIGENKGESADKPYRGDRTLILWNSKYAALNYVRRIYSYYKPFAKAIQGDTRLGNQNYLDSHLTPLEQQFGKFLVEGKDDKNSIAIAKPDSWKGFPNPQSITENLLGYFCFKPSNSVGGDTAVSLTDYAPLFSKYIVGYLRAQTGTNKTGEGSGISWTNTADFTDFIKKPALPNDEAKIQINKIYEPKLPQNLLSPSASLDDLTPATANELSNELQASFPANNYVLWNDFASIDGTSSQPVQPVQKQKIQQTTETIYAASEPTVVNTASGISPAALIGISLSVVFVLLAVFMGVVYRVSGLMSWFGMMFGLAVTFFLFFKFAGIFSIVSALGLLIVAMLSIFSWIHTFELFRRNLKQMIPVFTAFRLALRQAVMTVIDMHIIAFLFALPLLFLGKYSEQSFSIIIIVGALLSFFIAYLFSLLTIRLFLSNHTWKNSKFLIMGKYRLHASSPITQNNQETLSTQHPTFGLQPFKFNKRCIWLLVLFSVSAILPIIGFVVGSQHDLVIANFSDVLIKNGVVSLLFSGIIGLIYLAFRYRWIIILPFCFNCLFAAFILFGSPYILLLPTDSVKQGDVIVMMTIYILSLLFFISSADLQRRYFQKNTFYTDEEFNHQVNLSLKNRLYPNILLLSVVLLTFNPLFIFGACDGQKSGDIANQILLFNVLVGLVFLINLYLNSYLFLWMIYLRNKLIKTHTKHDDHTTHGEHEWKSISYDSNDEQLIVGINSRH